MENTVYNGTPDEMLVRINNQGEHEYTFGDFFQLEQKKDELWYIVPYSDAVFYEYPSFKNYGRRLAPGEKVKQAFSPQKLHLELPKGEYRLVKTLIHEEPSYEVSLAVIFEIN